MTAITGTHTAPWTFGLGDCVKMLRSTEDGQVIGRAEFLHAEPSYLVRYEDATGRQTEQWWGESALIAG